ncbi:MAG: tRNA 2-selenouridine(34) synthase MnmH [Firmicutes bacterium]|nr:tRNA 2-selenouridine(34) synthase MnmH [Bacillota bacterium]
MYKDKEITELFDESGSQIPMVDLRSPGEFAEATIPGAYNAPLLDNDERALVGKTYKQASPDRARELAMEIVAPKLPRFVKTVKSIAPGGEVNIFCWRGGERSRFAGLILDFMGLKVNRLKGGFKAYRHYVLAYLNGTLPHRAIVLHGLTGVGKTELLLALERAGYPVLDLEKLAAHRGSVFGKIGQPASPGQKMFEGQIQDCLRRLEKTGVFVVECESKRLGNLLVPDTVLNAMHSGYRVLVYAPVPLRVRRIKKDYFTATEGNLQTLREAIQRLARHLGGGKTEELNSRLEAGEVEQVINFLLTHYYDPLYKYPGGPDSDYDLSVAVEDVAQAAAVIGKWLNRLPEYKQRGVMG